MEYVEAQLLNSIDGYCDIAQSVPYFSSLERLRVAFNTVVESVGLPESMLHRDKHISNKLERADFAFARTKKKYDATALLYLVLSAVPDGSGQRQNVSESDVLAKAQRLGLRTWAGTTDAPDDSPRNQPQPEAESFDCAVAEAPAVPPTKRARLESRILACTADDQAAILEDFRRLKGKLQSHRQRSRRLETKLEVVTVDRDRALVALRGAPCKSAEGDFKL